MQTRLSYDLNEPLRKQSGRGPLFLASLVSGLFFVHSTTKGICSSSIHNITNIAHKVLSILAYSTHTICVAKSYVTIIIMTFALVRCIYAWDRQQHKNVQHSVEMLHFHDFTWNEQRIFKCVVLFALFFCESE